MNKTYNNILDEMKLIGEKVVNQVLIDNNYKFPNAERKYPFIGIDPHYNSHTFKDNLMKLNIKLYFVDLVKEDGSNELATISYMVEVMRNYINYLFINKTTLGFRIRKEQRDTMTYRTFTDRWPDEVSGCSIDILIDVPDSMNNCDNLFN